MAATLRTPTPETTPDVPRWLAYVHETRHPVYALITLLPLAMAAELGPLLGGAGTAGFRPLVARRLIETAASAFGGAGPWLAPAVLMITLGVWTYRSPRQRPRLAYLVLLPAEAMVAAIPLAVLARVAGTLAAGASLLPRVCEGIAAGVYEELVFRFFLVSTLLLVLRATKPRVPAGLVDVLAVALAGLAFAWFHFPPFGGEPYTTVGLLVRTLAGAYLGFLFVQRGLVVAAGTHCAYNTLMILGQGGAGF